MERIWFETQTIGSLPERACQRWGDREALLFQGRRWTFAEISRGRRSRGPRPDGARRSSPGETVALWMLNRPEWIEAMFAVMKIGSGAGAGQHAASAPMTSAYVLAPLRGEHRCSWSRARAPSTIWAWSASDGDSATPARDGRPGRVRTWRPRPTGSYRGTDLACRRRPRERGRAPRAGGGRRSRRSGLLALHLGNDRDSPRGSCMITPSCAT